MEVEIISKMCIKPTTPTPDNLKTYKISLIDQIIPSYYVPMILFYPVNQETGHLSGASFDSQRSLRLKQSLSEALTLFYPLAGKIKDDLTIDCDDEGACFVEARSVGCSLSEHLDHPDPKFNRKLLPAELNSWKPSPGSHVALVQETTFACGGVAIGVLITHMVADGMAFASFLKCWAAKAHMSGELGTVHLRPRFDAPSVFLQNDAYPKEATLMAFFRNFMRIGKAATRRFVFDASAIANLKAKAISSSVHNPSRVVVVSALLSKCVMAVFKARSSAYRPTLVSHAVNIRPRAVPPFPECSFGNIYCPAAALCTTEDTHLTTLVCQLRRAIEKVDGNIVKELQGDGGWLKLCELIKETSQSEYANSANGMDGIGFTSWCNFGLYDIDFGWGKPLWVVATVEPDEFQAQFATSIVLTNTRTSKGIEAWVCFEEREMALLEHDEELLAYVSVDPSPLHL